ncbi:MAG: hypothetical protein KDA65_08165 [Planctomycetaceae bacterium]|nr:hypothetical protein [Planctomycetaceae bacterium]
MQEPEPYWYPGFYRELNGKQIELIPIDDPESVSPRIHPEDQVILWSVLHQNPGEQVRQILSLQNRHPNLAVIILAPATMHSLKWVFYELQMLAVLDPQIPLMNGVKLCQRYWKSLIS